MSSVLYDPVGTGLVVSVAGNAGPIVGGREPCILIGTGGQLTTGDLASGDPLEMGGLFEFTFETWFKYNALPLGAETIAAGPACSVGPTVRQWTLGISTTGMLSFTVIDQASGVHTATATVALPVNVWHHLVCTARGGNTYIYVDDIVAASTTFAAVSVKPVVVSSGTQDFRVLSAAAGGGVQFFYSDMALYRMGLTADRIAAHYEAGVERGFDEELSGARVTAALDTVGSQAPRQVGAGQRTVIADYMVGQPARDEIDMARAADNVDAVFFASRDGTLVYLDAAHRASSPYNTVQATFDDDGTDLAYIDLDVDYSESFLVNEWAVTAVGTAKVPAATETVTDTTSVTRYYKRAQVVGGVPVTVDADALTIATAMLAKYKEPLTRIVSITLTTQVPDVAEAILERDIGDRIRVFRTPPGGGTRIDQTLFIQKIQIEAANTWQPWTVTWGLSPV